MEYTTCSECGGAFTQEQSTGHVCFRCKTRSIGFTWRGPTRASRQDFHDNTIRSVLAEGDRNADALGIKDQLEPIGTRWV